MALWRVSTKEYLESLLSSLLSSSDRSNFDFFAVVTTVMSCGDRLLTTTWPSARFAVVHGKHKNPCSWMFRHKLACIHGICPSEDTQMIKVMSVNNTTLQHE